VHRSWPNKTDPVNTFVWNNRQKKKKRQEKATQADVRNSTYLPEGELGICEQVLDCREVENGPAKNNELY
jgi:hypothetical protein